LWPPGATRWNPEHYRILGGGGEGEMPLRHDSVLARGYRVRDYPYKAQDINGVDVVGSLVPIEELVLALSDYRSLFRPEWKEENIRIRRMALRGSPEEMRRYAASSKTARHLVEETTTSDAWLETDGAPEKAPVPMKCIRSQDHGFQPSGFGQGLAFIGDVDGDGVEDLAVGAPGDDSMGSDHGAVRILFLNDDGSLRAHSKISERNGLTASLNDDAQFGSSVTSMGDLDGDGVADLLVGAPGWKYETGGLWLLFLDRRGQATRSVEVGGNLEAQPLGLSQGFRIGTSSCCLGDLDGDGSLETAVGQEPAYQYEREWGRSVLILSIRPDGHVVRAQAIRDRQDGFSEDSSWLGRALARVPDLDQDGVPELAIGDPSDPDGGLTRGAVWIVWLNSDASIKKKQKISAWAGGFEGLLKDASFFGSALISPGDLDGDGAPELVVGSEGGAWTLYLNADGTVDSHAFFGTDTGLLGTSFACSTTSAGINLVCRGSAGGTVLWMLRLLADGTVASR
jgi:hypothetical protein